MVDPSAQSRRPQHQLRRLDSPPFPVRLDPPFSRHPRVLRSAVHRLRSPRCNGDPFRAEQMAGRSGNGRKRGQIVRFHDHFLCAWRGRGRGLEQVWSAAGGFAQPGWVRRRGSARIMADAGPGRSVSGVRRPAGPAHRAEQMAGRSGNGRKWGRIVRFPDHFLCAVPRAGFDARRAGGGAGRTALRCLPAGRQSERRSPLACQRVPATGGPRHAESERGSFADRPTLGPLALPPPVRMGERGAEEWEVP
jgi:hypothetical protein